MMDGNWDGGSWWWMGLAMVAFWTVVVGAIVMLVRRRPDDSSGPDARTLLDERYARGEIDDDEYQQRRDALRR